MPGGGGERLSLKALYSRNGKDAKLAGKPVTKWDGAFKVVEAPRFDPAAPTTLIRNYNGDFWRCHESPPFESSSLPPCPTE